MVHFRRNVPKRAKRGVSDFATLLQDIEQEARTNRNVSIGVGALAAITTVVEHTTDSRMPDTPSVAGGDILSRFRAAQNGGGREVTTQKLHPGTRIDLKNKKFVQPPLTQFSTGALHETLKYILKRIGMRWQIPGFMLLGDTESALYNSVLAIGSPFVKAREQEQEEFGKKTVEMLWKALRVAYNTGVLKTSATFEEIRTLLKIEYTPPTVALQDETQVTARRATEHAAGIIDKRTWREQANYDNDEIEERLQSQTPAQPSQDISASVEQAKQNMGITEEIAKIVDDWKRKLISEEAQITEISQRENNATPES
jgi:hypothetical protein